jgi:chaperonin GroES
MNIEATNDNVWIIRQDSEVVRGGIHIPDSVKKKMHRGDIVTVGELVMDKKIKKGRTAIFNKSAGFEIDEDGITYVVLNQSEIIGVV